MDNYSSIIFDIVGFVTVIDWTHLPVLGLLICIHFTQIRFGPVLPVTQGIHGTNSSQEWEAWESLNSSLA